MSGQQPELVGVPAPTRESPGRCRAGERRTGWTSWPCPNPAEGMAWEWTAPLDPAQAVGSCWECAGIYRLRFTPLEATASTDSSGKR